MNKPSFSFVKWLTKRDVEKILKQNGYELNKELPSPYSKFKGEDGYYYIVTKCKKTELSDSEKLYKEVQKKICKEFSFESDLYLDTKILEFSDFMLLEYMNGFNNEETLSTSKSLTKNYHKFMKEKFGTFYTNMKKAYMKKLYKEEIEKEEN